MSKLKLYTVLVTSLEYPPSTYLVRAGLFDVAARKAVRAYRRAHVDAKAVRSSTAGSNLILIL